jgi:hypothetical protein
MELAWRVTICFIDVVVVVVVVIAAAAAAAVSSASNDWLVTDNFTRQFCNPQQISRY